MTINQFISFLLPRGKWFYPLFEKAAENLRVS
jgi:hypothetical protein